MYVPQIRVEYRVAAQDELPNGRSVDITDRAGGQSEILMSPRHTSRRLSSEITALSGHQIVHGAWRQRWTSGSRMNAPAQGLGLAVSRWERVPTRLLPTGRTVAGVEQAGMCVWLIDEDECDQRAANDMNDLLLRLAGDGLWLQVWFRRRPSAAGAGPVPLLAPLSPTALA